MRKFNIELLEQETELIFKLLDEKIGALEEEMLSIKTDEEYLEFGKDIEDRKNALEDIEIKLFKYVKKQKEENNVIVSEDVKFLKGLQDELNSQDTDGQAAPRFWVLREYVNEPTLDDYADDYVYIETNNYTEFKTVEEFIEFVEEQEAFSETRLQDLKSFNRLSDIYNYLYDNFINDGFKMLGVKKIAKIVPNTLFLTKREAEDFIKRNRHNLSESVHTYAMTALDSPNFKKLLEIISKTNLDG